MHHKHYFALRFQRKLFTPWKIKLGYSLHLVENKTTQGNINFHKILSFLCQECCSLKSLNSLPYLHSSTCICTIQCLRLANPHKAYQPTQHSTTNQKLKKRRNNIVIVGCNCLSSSKSNYQKVTITSPWNKSPKKTTLIMSYNTQDMPLGHTCNHSHLGLVTTLQLPSNHIVG